MKRRRAYTYSDVFAKIDASLSCPLVVGSMVEVKDDSRFGELKHIIVNDMQPEVTICYVQIGKEMCIFDQKELRVLCHKAF